MWRSKRLIIALTLAAVLLAGSIGGIALAQDEEENTRPELRAQAMMDRVSEIYQEKTGVALDQEALREAYTQAHQEQWEQAMQERLQYRVEQGQITQEQADELQRWWQEKPEVPFGSGFPGGHGRCAPRGSGMPGAWMR